MQVGTRARLQGRGGVTGGRERWQSLWVVGQWALEQAQR
jgi:hypothetical protein